MSQPGAATTGGSARVDSRRGRVGSLACLRTGYSGGDAGDRAQTPVVQRPPVGHRVQAVPDGSANAAHSLRRAGLAWSPARARGQHGLPELNLFYINITIPLRTGVERILESFIPA
eukprot:scaffold841_cov397-Prasinococcus_capsulatus_cf.AAC.6